MEERSVETIFIGETLEKCEDIEDLKERIFPMLQSQQQWKQKINEIIRKSGYTKIKFAKMCGVSRQAVDKWCKGAIPKKREYFVKIGLVAGYNLQQINQLLQRYGQYSALYSKNLQDCACIFVLNNNLSEDKIKDYLYITERIKENINNGKVDEEKTIETVEFNQKLLQLQDESALEQFIYENSSEFQKTYRRFYASINIYIKMNYPDFNVNNMSEVQGWSSSLKQCVYQIKQNKWYPTRNKIISLGLHLSMDREQIDDMLKLAYMEPLCPKNIFESIIIFVLEDASLNNILDKENEEFNPDGLCKYAKDVLDELDIAELKGFASELSGIDYDAW